MSPSGLSVNILGRFIVNKSPYILKHVANFQNSSSKKLSNYLIMIKSQNDPLLQLLAQKVLSII